MANTKNAGMVSTVAAANMLRKRSVVNERRDGASGGWEPSSVDGMGLAFGMSAGLPSGFM